MPVCSTPNTEWGKNICLEWKEKSAELLGLNTFMIITAAWAVFSTHSISLFFRDEDKKWGKKVQIFLTDYAIFGAKKTSFFYDHISQSHNTKSLSLVWETQERDWDWGLKTDCQMGFCLPFLKIALWCWALFNPLPSFRPFQLRIGSMTTGRILLTTNRIVK